MQWLRPRAPLASVSGVRFYSTPRLTALSVAATMPSKTPTLFDSPKASHGRKFLRLRPGLVAVKRGMVPFFDEQGVRHSCTVLEVDRVQVTDVKTKAKHGYYAVQLGIGARKFSNVTRPMLGHFARAQVAPKSYVTEFRVRDRRGLLPLGTLLSADHFKIGQFVDLKSKTKGKGTQGVMRRWNFGGLRASHGTSKKHRSAGSTGMNQDPGRTLPHKKMAGRMGNRNNTIFNSQIMDVDAEKGIVLVKGHVSGPDGAYVKILDALKKPLPKDIYDAVDQAARAPEQSA
uniref:Large ribosomal subunit protein uL3m n=1 Tax=Blastobotrys adeninivorans TaxID=409370 RepID=A0A060TAH3_BLAAD